MFDDLRRASEGPESFEPPVEEDPFELIDEPMPESRLFGMTAAQRFVISLILLMTVIVMGLMCLLVTGTVWLS